MNQLPLIRVLHRRLQQSAPQPVYVLARGTWRFLRPWISPRVMADHFPGIPGRVHHEDHMLDTRSANSTAKYRRVGLEAYQHIHRALHATGSDWPSVEAVLDYGCGHGRVLRWIAARHPRIHLMAADINEQAARFCAVEFGATPYVVDRDVAKLSLPAAFDVIWVGSVFTHLDEDDGYILLDRLVSALAPGGVLLFTTHGELLEERVPEYGRAVTGRSAEIRDTLMHGGVAFLPGDAIYGPVTFHARSAVRAQLAELPSCELVSLARRGWDDHHDVWTVVKKQPH